MAKPRFLAVEDDPNMSVVLRTLFDYAFYARPFYLQIEATVEGGLRALRAAKWDGVFADLRVAGGDGRDVYDAACDAGVPAMMITASVDLQRVGRPALPKVGLVSSLPRTLSEWGFDVEDLG